MKIINLLFRTADRLLRITLALLFFFAAVPLPAAAPSAGNSISSGSFTAAVCHCEEPETFHLGRQTFCLNCRGGVIICRCQWGKTHSTETNIKCPQCQKWLLAEKKKSQYCSCPKPKFHFSNAQWLCQQCALAIKICHCGSENSSDQPQLCSSCNGWIISEKEDLTQKELEWLRILTEIREERKRLADERRRLAAERRRLANERRQNKLEMERLARELDAREKRLLELEKKLDRRQAQIEKYLLILEKLKQQLADEKRKNVDSSAEECDSTCELPDGHSGFCCFIETVKDILWRWWRDNAIFEFFAYLGRIFTDQRNDIANPLQPTARDSAIMATYALLDATDQENTKAVKAREELFKSGALTDADKRNAPWVKFFMVENLFDIGNTLYSDDKRAIIPARWCLLESVAPSEYPPRSILIMEKNHGKWQVADIWKKEAVKNVDFDRVTFYDEPNDEDSIAAEKTAALFCQAVRLGQWEKAYKLCLDNSPLHNTDKNKIKAEINHSKAHLGFSAAPWSDVRIVPLATYRGTNTSFHCRIVMEKRCGKWYVSKIIE